nr:MAG: major capsid protein [Microvirus sp.]
MKPLFNSIRIKRPKRNVFDLSHERKLSLNMGDLVPIMVQDVVPGDKFQVSSEILMRLAPLISPVMHRVNVYTHYFFVPNRLIWNAWEDFITGGENGNLAPVFPKISFTTTDYTAGLLKAGSLADYLGIPHAGSAPYKFKAVSALPFRAYQMIYNDYYRDQNLTPKIDFGIGSTELDGYDTAEIAKLATLRKRVWEKDYFTSALPWAQRGGEVSLPTTVDYLDISKMVKSDGSNLSADEYAAGKGSVDSNNMQAQGAGADNDASIRIENIEGIDVTINDLRRSIKLQEWLEKNARGGSRYIEQILSHFGVISSDARLQRAEYLGGGKQPVVISEVLNTTGTEDLPQGNMAGHGISVGSSNRFKKTFEEHGFVIGIMSVLPRTAYQQGMERQWLKFDKFDYFWPEFANLGEQVIDSDEIHWDWGTNEAPVEFGYQSRYAEYKFKNSSVHGEFRNTLNHWHLGRIFDTRPGLNQTFIESNPSHRIFAVDDPEVHKLYCQIFNNVRAIRPMPVFGTPTL